MKLRVSLFLAFALMLAFAAVVGCGGKSEEAGTSSTETPAATTPATPAADSSQVLAKSLYDDGPRAFDAPIDAAAAAAGEKVFNTKGCVVCHHWGEKFTGPNLQGVTKQRTAAWMEHQMLDPIEMVKTDPISHQLFLENNKLQMTNQNLTPEEAKQVVEYLKKRDKDGK